MFVGIIAEGKSDIAVIQNILKGQLGLNVSDTYAAQPELDYDETSLHTMRTAQFSNWLLVKQACSDGTKFHSFFDAIDDDRMMVVHLDTDKRFDSGYDVPEPPKLSNKLDVATLVENVSARMFEWIDPQFNDRTVLAIAVQETDAWVLTDYLKDPETALLPDPKRKLDHEVNRSTRFSDKDRKRYLASDDIMVKYHFLSQAFRKPKSLLDCCTRNESLRLFCAKLETKGKPMIKEAVE